MSIGHLYILYGEMSIQVLCPFFKSDWWGFFVVVEWYTFTHGTLNHKKEGDLTFCDSMDGPGEQYAK